MAKYQSKPVVVDATQFRAMYSTALKYKGHHAYTTDWLIKYENGGEVIMNDEEFKKKYEPYVEGTMGTYLHPDARKTEKAAVLGMSYGRKTSTGITVPDGFVECKACKGTGLRTIGEGLNCERGLCTECNGVCYVHIPVVGKAKAFEGGVRIDGMAEEIVTRSFDYWSVNDLETFLRALARSSSLSKALCGMCEQFADSIAKDEMYKQVVHDEFAPAFKDEKTAPRGRTPNVGYGVWYFLEGEGPYAAIITAVGPGSAVDLIVFAPRNAPLPHGPRVQNISYVADTSSQTNWMWPE